MCEQNDRLKRTFDGRCTSVPEQRQNKFRHRDLETTIIVFATVLPRVVYPPFTYLYKVISPIRFDPIFDTDLNPDKEFD